MDPLRHTHLLWAREEAVDINRHKRAREAATSSIFYDTLITPLLYQFGTSKLLNTMLIIINKLALFP